jgi:hypothetical protein
METININGKEYSRDDFFEIIYIGSYYNAGDYKVADDIIEECWHSQVNDFPRQQPEPPTLRPMSELPEVNEWVNVLIQHNDDLFWGDGCICLNRIELRYLGQDCWKNKNYISEEKVKALGWLPKEVLPNPNEIKLPC